MNKFIHDLTGIKTGIFQILLLVCSLATFLISRIFSGETVLQWIWAGLAVFEFLCAIASFVYFKLDKKKRCARLENYLNSVIFDAEDARNRMLLSFPMPMAVFMPDDTRIVWANELFFKAAGAEALRFDAKLSELLPNFSAEWLLGGGKLCPDVISAGEKKYRVYGDLIQKEKRNTNSKTGKTNGKLNSKADGKTNSKAESETESKTESKTESITENITEGKTDSPLMCVTYWIDVTDSEAIRAEYRNTRPVAAVIVIDNYDEMVKNLPDREKNDVRDAIEDRLFAWAGSYAAILRRYDRDRYIMVLEKRDLDTMKEGRFSLLQEMHAVESPNGFSASLSMGFSDDTESMAEAVQFADQAVDLALTRGGDQTVIKNRLGFEFFGGRGGEVEKRTKVRSRVMANTIAELIKDSSKVYVMGHRYADLDCIGASAGICCIARQFGIESRIIVDDRSAGAPLIELLKTVQEYKSVFITTQEALQYSDGHTLLVITDTNRPEQLEEKALLDVCNRVAVIDHHRASATYIHNAALGFIEPSASSACELVTEIFQELEEPGKMLRVEADALLAGIVLDTKNFTMRTGEHTFNAASFLRHAGADTIDVKKLLQGGMEDTMQKYRILQTAELYRNVVVLAAPDFSTSRIVAAKAADELLNISGVEASIVVAPGETGGCFASARSIGDLNVQIIMEKLGGGGNRSAAAAQFPERTVEEVTGMVREAVDSYFDA